MNDITHSYLQKILVILFSIRMTGLRTAVLF